MSGTAKATSFVTRQLRRAARPKPLQSGCPILSRTCERVAVLRCFQGGSRVLPPPPDDLDNPSNQDHSGCPIHTRSTIARMGGRSASLPGKNRTSHFLLARPPKNARKSSCQPHKPRNPNKPKHIAVAYLPLPTAIINTGGSLRLDHEQTPLRKRKSRLKSLFLRILHTLGGGVPSRHHLK
jgi:hypothetical protein